MTVRISKYTSLIACSIREISLTRPKLARGGRAKRDLGRDVNKLLLRKANGGWTVSRTYHQVVQSIYWASAWVVPNKSVDEVFLQNSPCKVGILRLETLIQYYLERT